MYTFGNYAANAAESRGAKSVAIKMAELNDGTKWIGEETKYMTVSVQDDGQLVAERIHNIGREISKKILRDEGKSETNGDLIVFTHCDLMSHETVRCLGKIFCGGRTDKLDQKSCVFIGFDENKSRIVQLDFSRMKSPVQIFPGEVCIIAGNNPRGQTFYVTEIHSERILESCALPTKDKLSEPLHLVIASAPFTAADNLSFDYLDKLLENCVNNKPDVLILTGAFLPIESQLILEVASEIDEHFKKILGIIDDKVSGHTKVIIVSSANDINSSACFPTRPYKLKKLRPYQNIFMAPDPSIIDVNGIQLGVTSIDILQQLADAEFCM